MEDNVLPETIPMTHSFSVPSNASTEVHALILVAEDESEIAEILAAYLARSGLRTAVAQDGRKALELHLALKPDLIILDVQMPYVDGWQALAEIRRRGDTPVIMLTALDQDVDKVMGLRLGADDYVVKPFNPAEVVARVQAVLRRTSARSEPRERKILRVDEFQIDIDNHEVTVLGGGQQPSGQQPSSQQHALTLTLTEFRLLVHLVRMPNRVFSRAELLTSCLPEGDTLERTVDSHISKLRRKLEDHGITGVPDSVRGVGYRYRSAT